MEVVQLMQEVQDLRDENLLLRQELAQLKNLIFGSQRDRFIADASESNLFV